jgi:prevent-host-death family protein
VPEVDSVVPTLMGLPDTSTAGHMHLPGWRDVQEKKREMYAQAMDVAVSELRSHLSDYLARVRAGEELVVTERGLPVARLVGVDTDDVLERLTAEGVVNRPSLTRRPAAGLTRVSPKGSVSDLVAELRRSR